MRTLLFAYACEPGGGSEPGAGWGWATMLATLGPVTVITRAANERAINDGLRAIPSDRQPDFVFVDLPARWRFWKKGQRGVRLYYVLWLLAALRAGKRLLLHSEFDVVWHVTLANAWLGTTACMMPKEIPFIFGPVGAGASAPRRLMPLLGSKGRAYERMRAVMRASGRVVNPLARLAWRRARLILVQNPETRDWLPARYRGKASVLPHVVMYDRGQSAASRVEPGSAEDRVAVFAGRLLPWKGVALAIHALQQAPAWRLVICGAGSDEDRLKQMAGELGLASRVEFRGWLDPSEVQRQMHQAPVFMFPSLHDEAGWVVVEALEAQMAVLLLDCGGPPVLLPEGAGVKVDPDQPIERVIIDLAAGLERCAELRQHPDFAAHCREWVARFEPANRVREVERLLVDAGISPALKV